MKLSETPNSKDEPKILQSQDSLEDQDENENSENDIENDNNNDDVDAEQNITGVSFLSSLYKHLINFNNILD